MSGYHRHSGLAYLEVLEIFVRDTLSGSRVLLYRFIYLSTHSVIFGDVKTAFRFLLIKWIDHKWEGMFEDFSIIAINIYYML